MEKLAYVLFGPLSVAPATLANELAAHGAQRIAVNVSDAHVAPKLGARITRLDPTVGAVVTFWLESALARSAPEQVLRSAAPALAGYSVLESVALANTTHTAAPGERTPAVNMVALIAPKRGQARDEWLEYWLEEHRAVALETQATHAYVRNVVVRALTPGAPDWHGIVEEAFDTAAVGDPMAWYKAGGSQDTLRANLGRMIASCQKFLDLDAVESHPLSQYRF